MKFAESLECGRAAEERILAEIRRRYPCATRIVGRWSGYDIIIPETGCKVEVKKDLRSLDTGNILVEFEFNGHPSGILTTQADWWVITDDRSDWMITPQELRYFIFLNRLQYREIIGSGDYSKKKAFFIRRDDFIKYAKSLNIDEL
jgi:hypothetical protein